MHPGRLATGGSVGARPDSIDESAACCLIFVVVDYLPLQIQDPALAGTAVPSCDKANDHFVSWGATCIGSCPRHRASSVSKLLSCPPVRPYSIKASLDSNFSIAAHQFTALRSRTTHPTWQGEVITLHLPSTTFEHHHKLYSSHGFISSRALADCFWHSLPTHSWTG